MNNREFLIKLFLKIIQEMYFDLGEQVFNQFSTKSFPTNVYSQKINMF